MKNNELRAALTAAAEIGSGIIAIGGVVCAVLYSQPLFLLPAAWGFLTLYALLIYGGLVRRQEGGLRRWLAECSDAERWFAGFPDAVDAVRYVRDAAMGGKAEISGARDAMFGRSLHAHVRRVEQTAPLQPSHSDLLPIDGDMLVSRDALIARHMADVQRLTEFRPLPPTPTHFEGFLPAVEDRVAYKFLSAECADAS